MKPVRLVIALIVGAAIAGGGYYYYRQQRAADGHELVLYGNVDIREADLAFNDAGRIEKMLVEEGDPVVPGQLLARLDPTGSRPRSRPLRAVSARKRRCSIAFCAAAGPRRSKRRDRMSRRSRPNSRTSPGELQRLEKLALDRFAPRRNWTTPASVRRSPPTSRLPAALSLAIQGPRKEDIAKARAAATSRRRRS